MGCIRATKIKKSIDELIHEYCEKLNTDEEELRQWLKDNEKTDLCVENMARKEGIDRYRRVYLEIKRRYQIEIREKGKIQQIIEAEGDTVEKAIKNQTGYSVKLRKAKPDRADLKVTLLDSDIPLRNTTEREFYYRITSTHRYNGNKYEEIDWKTGQVLSVRYCRDYLSEDE